MKIKLIAFSLIVISLAAVPTTVWAETQSWTPPPEKGTVWVIVRFTKGYGIVPTNHNVSIQWGNWQKSGVFRTGGRTPKEGFVIRLRHTKNDSVPITVSTDGRIVRIYQGDAPREWSDGLWLTANW